MHIMHLIFKLATVDHHEIDHELMDAMGHVT